MKLKLWLSYALPLSVLEVLFFPAGMLLEDDEMIDCFPHAGVYVASWRIHKYYTLMRRARIHSNVKMIWTDGNKVN
jgi:hypothetical protein